ncbi:SAG family member [Eimeria mitis]|uniref:SAG family member n=1 Tax=Eimeria mitis TaxID=44415 RepID=U6K5F6_9EIME|nr:SAG family member [Eimeria mitis]CDJ32989.1 SAG family member [Eimeria mitis]
MAVLKFLSVAAAAILFSEINWAYGGDDNLEQNDQNLDKEEDSGHQEDGSGQGTENVGAGSATNKAEINWAYGGDDNLEQNDPNLDKEEDSGHQEDGSGPGTEDIGAATATNKAVRAECWEQMNAARNHVGFAELTQKNIFKITENDWTRSVNTLENYLSTVCKGIKTDKVPDELTTVEGTVAYAVQEGEQADCQAAVDYWKEALTNFNGEVPPAYAANASPYDNTQNVSFISLFNPQANPTVDCAYFVCPAATEKAKEGEGNTDTDKSMNALICVTSPSALSKTKGQGAGGKY